MSHNTITIWRCDRCDKEERRNEREQPPRWVRVMVTTPPLMSPSEADNRSTDHDKQLCEECRTDLTLWLSADPGRIGRS